MPVAPALVSVLMRMVFVRFAEERGLLPIENDLYASNDSLTRLHAQLRADADRFGVIDDRYGAWARVLSLFRLLHNGVVYGDFEWDENKATANAAKHGVTFEEATTVFADPCFILLADAASAGRLLVLGLSGAARMLVVVHVERGPRVRTIGARRATHSEQASYERRRF